MYSSSVLKINQHLALEVSLLLFCTPRIILSCEGVWTSPAQFSRQWAAVRKMLLPIWEKFREKKRDDLTNHCCSASAIFSTCLPFSQQKSHPWMIKGLTRDFDKWNYFKTVLLIKVCIVQFVCFVQMCFFFFKLSHHQDTITNNKNIASGTTDPEIYSVTWTKFGNHVAPLSLVAYLATRWHHVH